MTKQIGEITENINKAIRITYPGSSFIYCLTVLREIDLLDSNDDVIFQMQLLELASSCQRLEIGLQKTCRWDRSEAVHLRPSSNSELKTPDDASPAVPRIFFYSGFSST